MAVPKKKVSKSKSKTRHSAYMAKQRKRIVDWVNLVKCKECWAMNQNHTVCKECGMYKWKQIVQEKEKQKDVTVMQA